MLARPLLVTVAAICLLVGCTPAPVVPSDDDDTTSIDDTPHITVVGTAHTEVVPDTAVIRIGVSAEKPTAADAWESDSKLSRAVVDAAKAAGIGSPDIGTAQVDLAQQFDDVRQPDGTTKRTPRGFKASQSLTIKLTDFSKIGSLTQTLIDKGADSFEGVSFSNAPNGAVEDKLRGDAVRDARHQADILAKAAGVTLGRLLQIERPDQPGAARPFVRSLAANGMPIEPGTQTLSAEVEATYAIE